MKLFRRTDTTQQVPAELQPYYDGDTGWKLWVRRAVYALVALLILFAIGWAAWAVYNRVTDDGTDTPNKPIGQSADKSSNNNTNKSDAGSKTNNNTDKNKTAQNNKDTTKSQGTSGSSNTQNQPSQLPSGESSQSQGGKETSSAATTTPNAIPKTGPADVAAVAIGASIAGGIFHRFFLSRRQVR